MLKKQVLALAFTGLSAFTGAQAAEEFLDDRFYVAPYGTFLGTAGDRNASDGWGAGLAIGKIINEYFNVEIKGYWQNYSGHALGYYPRSNADLIGGTVDLQYFLFRDTFSPYIVAAMGGQSTSWRSNAIPGWAAAGRAPGNVGIPARHINESSFVFETGVGATYEITDNFLLRADVRYRLDTSPTSYSSNLPSYTINGNTVNGISNRVSNNAPSVYNDLLVNVGFVIPFGDKPVATRVAPPAAAQDCASRDSDRDGVNDCDDKCPNTAKGIKVDEYGCPIRIELKGVNFKYDSAELTDTAKAILDKTAVDLGAYPVKKNIEVRGHASSEGTNEYNLRLSQRRSQSVADYLKRKGVSNKLIAKGYGEEYPIADNNTEAGREKNRRVELVWTGE
jgi:OOP family OmpA-OmpF porin